MRILLEEIFRIYKKEFFLITFLWMLDTTEALILLLNPYVIGMGIDGLIQKDFFWFSVLMVMEVAFLVIHTVNKFCDTRVYMKIIENEKNMYYQRFIEAGMDDSLISSRMEMVEEVPEFLEFDLFSIINVIGGIIVSLIFLLFNSNYIVFGLALFVSAITFFTTFKFHNRIIRNNEYIKDLDEEKVKCICSRQKYIYGKFLKKIVEVEIASSDLDAKVFLVTRFFQVILLGVSIVSIIYSGNYTSGMLLSAITYITLLNDNVNEVHDKIESVQGLKKTVIRLKEDGTDEL